MNSHSDLQQKEMSSKEKRLDIQPRKTQKTKYDEIVQRVPSPLLKNNRDKDPTNSILLCLLTDSTPWLSLVRGEKLVVTKTQGRKGMEKSCIPVKALMTAGTEMSLEITAVRKIKLFNLITQPYYRIF